MSYNANVYRDQDGDKTTVASGGEIAVESGGQIAVESGGELDIESGGALKVAGVDLTAKLAAVAAQSTGTAYATVAAAGSTQADAAALAADFVVVTAADAAKGVKLPAATVGLRIKVKNNANAVLKVYPATGAAINAVAANGALEMAANTTAEFWASSATQWFTHPLLPS